MTGSSHPSTTETRIHELQLRAVRYAGDKPVEPSSLSSLSEGELARLVDGLERTAEPCGCNEGAVGASLAFALWPVWIGLRRRPYTVLAGAARTLELIPVTVLSALAFKGAGIVRGRVRHQRLRGALGAAAGHGEAERGCGGSADPSARSPRILT